MSAPLLEVHELATHFAVKRGTIVERRVGTVRAVDGVSFALRRGEVLGLVGESGCGKSTLARTILGLAPATSGCVRFEGTDLTLLSPRQLRRIRPRLQMVFQDPYASLNPRMTVYSTLAEPLRAHRIVPPGEVRAEATRLMERVGLAPRFMRKYPHEFSGGQRQRIAIARALAMRPELIIADEPVSALDVSVQAQILNLLSELRREMGLTMIFISHDLAVVRHIASRIAVMYLGKIVEEGPAAQVFERPRHPYTQALLRAIPKPEPPEPGVTIETVAAKGDPPSPMNPPAGCAFHPRCLYETEKCRSVVPPLLTAGEDQRAACVRLGEIP